MGCLNFNPARNYVSAYRRTTSNRVERSRLAFMNTALNLGSPESDVWLSEPRGTPRGCSAMLNQRKPPDGPHSLRGGTNILNGCRKLRCRKQDEKEICAVSICRSYKYWVCYGALKINWRLNVYIYFSVKTHLKTSKRLI